MQAFVKKQIFYSRQVFLERSLPKDGEILVKEGERVKTFDILGQTYLSAFVRSVTLPSGSNLLVLDGENVVWGQTLAKAGTWLKKKEIKSPISGLVYLKEGRLEIAGEPEKFNLVAGVEAKVVKVLPKKACLLETEATYVKGVWACGTEAVGEIKFMGETASALKTNDLGPSDLGKILVYPGFVPLSILQKAKAVGAVGFVAASVEKAKDCAINLLVTEGFGPAAMPGNLKRFLSSTKLKTAVISPERRQLIVPGLYEAKAFTKEEFPERSELKVGDRIQVLVWPHFGQEGEVLELLNEVIFESGIKAPAAKVKVLENNEEINLALSSLLILPAT